MKRIVIAVLALLFVPTVFVVAQEDRTDVASTASPEQIRKSIDRGLALLERDGRNWREQRKCISCHRITFLTWAQSEAGRRGFSIDEDKQAEWIEWSVGSSLALRGDKPDGALNIDGLAQILLQDAAEGRVSEAQRNEMVQIVLEGQEPDGSWKPAGQLPAQKRPLPETQQVSTMWIALALGSRDCGEAAAESRNRAIRFLEDVEPGLSTEWHVVKLLLDRQQGQAESAAKVIEMLKTRQNEDGGWGWKLGEQSDAIGTGMVLYAMRISAVATDDPSVDRATRFLLGTQLDDGSWAVRGTKTARKDKVEETASYWGAGWATLALLQTVP